MAVYRVGDVTRRSRSARVLATGVAMLAVACSDARLAEPQPEIAEQLTTTTQAAAADVIPGAGGGEATTTTLPGAGRTVVVATGTRPGDALVAAVVIEALTSLGYEVLDPDSFVLPEFAATLAIGEGDVDLWVGRRSALDGLLAPVTSAGSPAADGLTDVTLLVDGLDAGLVWLPATPDTAALEAPDLWAMLTDPAIARTADHDGDGRPEIWGCGERSACAAWLRTLEPLLPSEPGTTPRLDDVAQLVPDDPEAAGLDLAVDPAVGRIVFTAVGLGSGAFLDAAGAAPTWLGAASVPDAGDADVGDRPLPPGPWPVGLTLAGAVEWLEAQPPEVVDALVALEIDDDLAAAVRAAG